MSFNTECNLFNESLRRDSFSDRVCDDLSEVILQFLAIEDKFRLECVSKQFQRTVFQKHYKLVINNSFFEILRKRGENFDLLLKKLPQLLSLIQTQPTRESQIFFNESEIDSILKYCNNLIEFNCDLGHISEKYQLLFGRKFTENKLGRGWELKKEFGKLSMDKRKEKEENKETCKSESQLKIFFGTGNHSEMISKYFSNIEELNTYTDGVLCSAGINFRELSKCHLKNLKKLTVTYEGLGFEDELSAFQAFYERHKNITHLSITFSEDCEFHSRFWRPTKFEPIFQVLSQFNDLIHFELRRSYWSYSLKGDLIADSIKQMAKNCCKLKSLVIESIHVWGTPLEKPLRVLTEVRNFKLLNRLEFYISCDSPKDMKGIEMFLNQSLKVLSNLTHLKITFSDSTQFSATIEEQLITEFDIHLPKLKNLFIGYEFKATERTGDILSRLSRLEYLVLYITDYSIRDIIETKVTKNCRKIKKIEIIESPVHRN